MEFKAPIRFLRHLRRNRELRKVAAGATGFLASYPKSGRTWFRFILANYFGAIAGQSSEITLHSMFSLIPNFDFDLTRGLPAFRSQKRSYELPLILVSHLQYQRSLFQNRPVVFMVRDPRDVLVSSYFHATRHKMRFQGGIADFLMDPQYGILDLIQYLNGWAEGLCHHRAHILTYEDLGADATTATADVLSFLGIHVDQNFLAAAVEAALFKNMQTREKSEGIPAHEYDRSDAESLRMRRGISGGFADYLSPDEVSLIEAGFRSTLTGPAKMLVAKTGFLID